MMWCYGSFACITMDHAFSQHLKQLSLVVVLSHKVLKFSANWGCFLADIRMPFPLFSLVCSLILSDL